jgi:hypothetical protein
MKNVPTPQVKQLLEVIQSKPGQRIVHFADAPEFLSKHLSDLCKENESTYYIYCANETFFASTSLAFSEYAHIKVLNFKLARPRYLMQAIEFDYLIVTLDFQNQDKDAFLKKCYDIVRTGGNIIIVIPNASYDARDEWTESLTEQSYVSISIIEDIFEKYDVIVAKRMHGWGT